MSGVAREPSMRVTIVRIQWLAEPGKIKEPVLFDEHVIADLCGGFSKNWGEVMPLHPPEGLVPASAQMV